VAFVDIETTGCTPGQHRIIDVAVIGATGDTVDFEWQSLVNPGVRVPAGITELTGIDNEMLADAPPFERVAKELHERLEGRVFIAHNVRFDYGFIRREFAYMGTQWRSPNLCTVRLSRALYPLMPRHNLDAVMERHDIHIENRHRAMPDAQALLAFWHKLRAAWSAAELQGALDVASQRATLPPSLPPDLADDLPEGPGVYRFFGPEDTLLYVARANILRERVLDHFRGGPGSPRARKLAAEVRRVEWTETAGELGAWLLEAREVRETQPAYNRLQRGAGERFTWLFEEGDCAPRLMELDAEVLRSNDAFGTYRSERDARRALEALAREHQWCFKLLGLEGGQESAEGSCFGLQVGRCKGACVGKEPALLHMARVKIGLMPLRLKPWPHEGPVMLREGAGERQQWHIVDAWQHLGSFDPGDEDAIAMLVRASRRSTERFDIDAYRTLTRFMRDPRHPPQPLPRAR
jgi:DNA polymerase-3 subunit epsilon